MEFRSVPEWRQRELLRSFADNLLVPAYPLVNKANVNPEFLSIRFVMNIKKAGKPIPITPREIIAGIRARSHPDELHSR
jgi:hypothetical protein